MTRDIHVKADVESRLVDYSDIQTMIMLLSLQVRTNENQKNCKKHRDMIFCFNYHALTPVIVDFFAQREWRLLTSHLNVFKNSNSK
ncbi:MAG: hypothetical protein CMP86_13865 [Gammaproteobacteria bacterium]|nr:hypothetical protein [Gammaproteobacteria bacterium]